MPEQHDFEARLKAYLARAAQTPPPSGMDARFIGSARRPKSWAPQLVAAAAVLVLAIGLGIVLQQARQSNSVVPGGPTPTMSPTPATSTPTPTPTSATPSPSAVANGPSGIGDPSAAYDEARQVVVLFGGRDITGNFLGQTWEWNGRSWTQLQPATSPSARALGAIAYDAKNQQIVLFGGQPRETVGICEHLRDTWIWDGASWKAIAAAVTPDLCEARAAFDHQTNTVIVFGYGAGGRAETWSWDGRSWSQLHPASQPSGRHAAGMTWDTASRAILLFGGCNQSEGDLNDTWLWNGRTWTKQQPAMSPLRRSYAIVTVLRTSRGTLLHGGLTNQTFLNDTWLWNGSTWAPIKTATTPPPRVGGVGAPDPVNEAVIFGGVGPQADPNWMADETWTWTGLDWKRS